MKNPKITQVTKILTAIAKKHLDLDTLESRNMDSLDFSDQSVRSIKSALQEAFEVGFEAGFKLNQK